MPNDTPETAPAHPAAPKASRLDQMLPSYWGEPEYFEETRTVAAVAQAKALEGIENAVTLIAAEVLDALEELTDVIRAMGGETLPILRADSEEPVGYIET